MAQSYIGNKLRQYAHQFDEVEKDIHTEKWAVNYDKLLKQLAQEFIEICSYNNIDLEMAT